MCVPFGRLRRIDALPTQPLLVVRRDPGRDGAVVDRCGVFQARVDPDRAGAGTPAAVKLPNQRPTQSAERPFRGGLFKVTGSNVAARPALHAERMQ